MKSSALSSAILVISLATLSGCGAAAIDQPESSAPASEAVDGAGEDAGSGAVDGAGDDLGSGTSDSVGDGVGNGATGGAGDAGEPGTTSTMTSSMAGGEGVAGGSAAVGASGTPGADAYASQGGFGIGSCEVTVTGDFERSFTESVESLAPVPMALRGPFRTRHWMTNAEVADLTERTLATSREIFESMAGRTTPDPNANPTQAAAVQAAMTAAADALVSAAGGQGFLGMVAPIFELSCSTRDADGVFIIMFQNAAADEAQIPFAAGTYEIPAEDWLSAGLAGGKPFAPVVTASEPLTDAAPRDMIMFEVTRPGRFEIARFDADRVEGTFAFDAAEQPRGGDATPAAPGRRTIHVDGRFAFRCPKAGGCGQP